MNSHSEKVNFIWEIADLLRGDYKQSEYGRVILPFTVLRRMDCVLQDTKEDVLAKKKELEDMDLQNMDPLLNKVAGYDFHNSSRFDFKKLLDDPNNIRSNLMNYIHGFSKNAREILEYFNFEVHIERLDDADLLYVVVQHFSEVDIHPDTVSNKEMGDIFEELVRKFSEQSNETAGEHFTPREVIKLMVNILFEEDYDLLQKEGIVRTIYDPACGTGGMLTVAENYLNKLNRNATLKMFGQELNPETYAICKGDMLIKGENVDNIKYGNSFTNDKLKNERFDYMLSNPPFGVSWKKIRDEVEKEADELGMDGRFGAGLPRVNDGSFLFLQHMISKMKKNGEQGSRIAIVFNASPLFNGDAGSGESNIRRWIIENDWLEAIIGLPEELFYNTGINTYIWIVTNRKNKERQGKVQLINAVDFYEDMRKSKGNKRKYISEEQIDELTRMYGAFEENEYCQIFDNEDFGYHKIRVEQPIRRCYQVNKEKIEEFKGEDGFERIADRKNGEHIQEQIVEGLYDKFDFDRVYINHGEFIEDIEEMFSDVDIRLYKYIREALFAAFGWEDEEAQPAKDKDGNMIPDPDLREYERVPLKEDVGEYFQREIEPHLEEAWIDHSATKIGYEIPFTRYFYEYEELRSLDEIDNDIKKVKQEIEDLLEEVVS